MQPVKVGDRVRITREGVVTQSLHPSSSEASFTMKCENGNTYWAFKNVDKVEILETPIRVGDTVVHKGIPGAMPAKVIHIIGDKMWVCLSGDTDCIRAISDYEVVRTNG